MFQQTERTRRKLREAMRALTTERQALIDDLDRDIAAKSALRQVLLEIDRAEREAIAGAPRRVRRVL